MKATLRVIRSPLVVAMLSIVIAPATGFAFGTAHLPISYRSWTLEADSSGAKTTISQFHAPLEATVALGPHADLLVATAGASSSLDLEEGSTVTLGGATDVAAQMVWRLAGDRLLLQGGVNVPTGKRELDLSQFALSRLLGQPLLGFRLDEYGRGFDWTAGAAASLPLRELIVLGFGAGYIEHGEYRLLAEGAEYRPGSEASFSFGWDAGIDENGESPLRLDATYRAYGKDELGPAIVFEEGNQLEAQIDVRGSNPAFRPQLLLRLVTKSDNVAHGLVGNTIAAIKTRAGKQYVTAFSVDRRLSDRLNLGLGSSWIRFNEIDPPGQEGDAFEIGPGLGIAMGGSARIDLGARYLWGTLKPRDTEGARLSRVDMHGTFFTFGLSLVAN